MRYSIPALAAVLAASFTLTAQAQTVAVAPTQAPPQQDMVRMKSDANAVVAALRNGMPLGYLCFRGEDGVRRTVSATFDDVLKAKQEAAAKSNTAFTIGYDRKQAEAMVGDAMVASCVASYVGAASAYPSF
ncbi:hypothetical protein [uncultured Ferrovibrio sp.]|jgi:hypothetical protein|uniref:hypothetical protein n=1 Tax=uncultured Ferrovibrio sp. TaxID=1576913 RepID=UPI002616EEC3|nr:hypothetical protein [uncultured Ferrovibrio sp.]